MNQPQTKKQKATDQLAYYDDLIANYVDVIERLNQHGSADEAKVLIGLANESIQHCQDKRAILVSYLDSLSE